MPRVPSPAARHVGEHIATARKERGLTQDDLASLTGIDSSNIRGYESGRAMVSVQTLVRIADALRLEPGALLRGIELGMFTVPEHDGRRRAG